MGCSNAHAAPLWPRAEKKVLEAVLAVVFMAIVQPRVQEDFKVLNRHSLCYIPLKDLVWARACCMSKTLHVALNGHEDLQLGCQKRIRRHRPTARSTLHISFKRPVRGYQSFFGVVRPSGGERYDGDLMPVTDV